MFISREKQIDEMANTILDCDRAYYGLECDEVQAKCEATALYTAGYRKASEVAEEIFAEIDKLLAVDRNGEANLDVRALAELKKKYTEGEK